MTIGRRFNSRRISVVCLTRSLGGVVAGCVLSAGPWGCVPTQTKASSTGGVLSTATAAAQLSPARYDRSVRIEAIQRYDGERAEPITGVVTVRNTSSAPRTVSVGVTWLSLDGREIGSDGSVLETVTLAPRESRELVFRGEEGSRDFKVALTSAVQ
jgi:hypothetical protein